MNIYKTALSALILAPIVGGIGLHTIKQYQAMKEKAEELTRMSKESIQEVEAVLDGELEDVTILNENLESDSEILNNYPEVESSDEILNGSLTVEGLENIDWQLDENMSLEEVQVEGLSEDSFATDIANEVIRFHVRANSDSEEDQALKLLVRDAILEEMGSKLADAESKDEAREIMVSNLSNIENIAKEAINKAGYDYEVSAYLTVEEFPMKNYGDLMFPAGEYEALRVDIGTHDGANWWCVMYPGLCFVDTTGGVVATEGKEELQRALTPEEYEEILISPSDDTEIEYRSYIWDCLLGKE